MSFPPTETRPPMGERDAIFQAVVGHLSDRTGIPRSAIREETALGQDGLGLDSIGCLELLLAIEQGCGLRLRNEDLTGDPFASVGSLVDYVIAQTHG